ncbi:MAG: DCC1-like thiol-disulfide oxidoreductase family protein, partial [Armatimonadota bacterium]|nr:DCC1-like thiol-disulfide oxidoreductase family protein [Armatimonadota bacterium]
MGALRSLPGRLRRAAQLTVLYDGWCSLCTRSVRRLSRLDLLSLVQFVSFRHPGVLERYRVDRARAERRVLGIDARGRIREGADVMVQIAVRLPLLWPLLPVLVVGRLLVGQRLYDALAGRRAVLVPGSRVLSCKQSIHVSPAEVQVGSLMGLTFIDGTVRGGDSKEVTVRFLVDS